MIRPGVGSNCRPPRLRADVLSIFFSLNNAKNIIYVAKSLGIMKMSKNVSLNGSVLVLKIYLQMASMSDHIDWESMFVQHEGYTLRNE